MPTALGSLVEQVLVISSLLTADFSLVKTSVTHRLGKIVKEQSQELTRVNPDRNIFSINVELTSTFLLYRGLVHHIIEFKIAQQLSRELPICTTDI